VSHPLLQLQLDAADGRFPPVDGRVEVVPACGRNTAVVAFTGHAVVATDRSPVAEVIERAGDGFGAALAPDFLRWLAGPTGWIDSIDAVLVARGLGGGSLTPRHDLDDHPRVGFARQLRDDVRVFGDERGLFTLGLGLAGRLEVSVEVAPEARGRGLGRSLLADARSLVPAGVPVFAAVAPGNAASFRAFLAAGFQPLAAQVVIQPS
jgi:GNAT superfamily N-acetyltransferase